MGFSNCMFVVSIILCATWGLRIDIPCAAKSYPGESVVCVCNATYCDNLVREVPCRGKYVAYTSTTSGLRLKKTFGKLKTYSQTASAKYNKILYLNPSVKFQKIEGFGSAVTDSAAINWLSVSKPVREALISSYYGKSGIGYSLARVPIGGTDFSKYFYSYDYYHHPDPKLIRFSLNKWDYKYKIPMVKAIQNVTVTPLKVHSTLWAPPEWMVTKTNFNACGRMKKEYYQALADYHKKFIEEYASNGIPIWAISTINEPSIGHMPILQRGNCLVWESEDMGNWLAQNLGPTIRNMTQKVLILGNEDMRLFLPLWIKLMVQKVPEALKYIDGISVHFYYDNISPPTLLDDVHDIYPDKFLLYTESCTGLQVKPSVALGSWSRAEEYMQNIIENINHHVVGWVDWNMCLNLHGGPTWISNFVDSPIIVFSKGDYFVKQPMFYAMAHVAKFAVRGSYRIKVVEENNSDNSVDQFAVLTPNNTIAVVLHNRADSAAAVGIVLGDSVVDLNLLPKSFTTVELPNQDSGCQLNTKEMKVPGTTVNVEYDEDSVCVTYNTC